MDGSSGAFNKLAGKKQFWLHINGEGSGDGRRDDLITVTYADGRTEKVPYTPGRIIDLRPDAPGWSGGRGFGKRFK